MSENARDLIAGQLETLSLGVGAVSDDRNSLANQSWRVLMASFSDSMNNIPWIQPDVFNVLYVSQRCVVVTERTAFTSSILQSRRHTTQELVTSLFNPGLHRTQHMQNAIDSIHPVLQSWMRGSMGWDCVNPYDADTATTGDRVGSCVRRNGGRYAMFQNCVENCTTDAASNPNPNHPNMDNIVLLRIEDENDIFFKFAPGNPNPFLRTNMTGFVVVQNDQAFFQTSDGNWPTIAQHVKFAFQI